MYYEYWTDKQKYFYVLTSYKETCLAINHAKSVLKKKGMCHEFWNFKILLKASLAIYADLDLLLSSTGNSYNGSNIEKYQIILFLFMATN